jgi:PHD/YefM family antitoxin component YafN of YafNO toxin-antitoxin module
MFEVKGDAAVATVSELRRDVKKTVEAAHRAPVYLTNDGKLVAAVVSVGLLDRVFELLHDVEDAQLAMRRRSRAQTGESPLLSEEEFWEKVAVRRGARVPKAG